MYLDHEFKLMIHNSNLAITHLWGHPPPLNYLDIRTSTSITYYFFSNKKLQEVGFVNQFPHCYD